MARSPHARPASLPGVGGGSRVVRRRSVGGALEDLLSPIRKDLHNAAVLPPYDGGEAKRKSPSARFNPSCPNVIHLCLHAQASVRQKSPSFYGVRFKGRAGQTRALALGACAAGSRRSLGGKASCLPCAPTGAPSSRPNEVSALARAREGRMPSLRGRVLAKRYRSSNHRALPSDHGSMGAANGKRRPSWHDAAILRGSAPCTRRCGRTCRDPRRGA